MSTDYDHTLPGEAAFIDHLDTIGGKPLCLLGVVNQRAEGDYVATRGFLDRAIGEVDGALYAHAESKAFRQEYFH